MSASLVGSEMCIRDSGQRVRRPASCSDPRKRRWFSSERSFPSEVGHAPVSYTHLTLPTICSV
eukprot:4673103-Alexandrium_andersonii.AAC.1